MSCDSPVVTHGQKNTAELTGCILKLSVQTLQKLGIFYLLSNTDGNPWTRDKHQVSGFSGTTATKHNFSNHYTETKQKIIFIVITYIL
jgi:hypothetical protein